MEKKYISAVLGSIPVTGFVLICYFAAVSGTLTEVRANYALFYLDWVFLFFNLLLPYAIGIKWRRVFIFYIPSLAILFAIQYSWDWLGPVGLVHLAIMPLEAALFISMILAEPANLKAYVIAMLFPAAYFLSALFVVIFIYSRGTDWIEISLDALGLAIIMLRLWHLSSSRR
ncbi:MAG: hypothetical protein QS98_C0013G0023 [archaeon GW2011_AR3]|nr:MAG: hypothetical protein QS98_C0013G0023 [archaeon GW2011_AR3]MBS3108969.1 hypothetical protein [Candidatus Woesearchaeota archaeon]